MFLSLLSTFASSLNFFLIYFRTNYYCMQHNLLFWNKQFSQQSGFWVFVCFVEFGVQEVSEVLFEEPENLRFGHE